MGRPLGPSTKTVDNELFLQSLQRCAAHSNCPQLPVSRSSLNRAPTELPRVSSLVQASAVPPPRRRHRPLR